MAQIRIRIVRFVAVGARSTDVVQEGKERRRILADVKDDRTLVAESSLVYSTE